MDEDGAGMRAITAYGAGGARATQPRWAADGALIVYTRTGPNGQPRHIWAMRADGSEDSPVLTVGLFAHPTLQPET